MSILELRNVEKSYRRGGVFGRRESCKILSDISLTIDQGACVGLLGRSGSGKSTLARIALGLERPDSGECLFCGRPIQGLHKGDYRQFRKNVQVVFQSSLGSVNPRWTVGRIIAEPLVNFKTAAFEALSGRVEELLHQVGLDPAWANRFPQQLSGGELQRICIARALALNPMLIILDEAVSSLDMLLQVRIIGLLRKLQQELGVAFLFISHDIKVLLHMCDQFLVMEKGRIVARATNAGELSGVDQPGFIDLIRAILPSAPHPDTRFQGDLPGLPFRNEKSPSLNFAD